MVGWSINFKWIKKKKRTPDNQTKKKPQRHSEDQTCPVTEREFFHYNKRKTNNAQWYWQRALVENGPAQHLTNIRTWTHQITLHITSWRSVPGACSHTPAHTIALNTRPHAAAIHVHIHAFTHSHVAYVTTHTTFSHLKYSMPGSCSQWFWTHGHIHTQVLEFLTHAHKQKHTLWDSTQKISNTLKNLKWHSVVRGGFERKVTNTQTQVLEFLKHTQTKTHIPHSENRNTNITSHHITHPKAHIDISCRALVHNGFERTVTHTHTHTHTHTTSQ